MSEELEELGESNCHSQVVLPVFKDIWFPSVEMDAAL